MRSVDVFNNTSGAFQHTFTPSGSEAGIYTVSIVHPDIVDRPDHGQFTVGRVQVKPTTIDLRMPRNYSQAIVLDVLTGEGTTATNLHVEYNAADQQNSHRPRQSLGP